MTFMAGDKKRAHTAVVVFVVACAGALIVSGQWRTFFLGSVARPGGSPAPARIAQGAGRDELYERLEQESQRFILQRDPFTIVPIVAAKPASEGISVRGIMWDPGHPMAIINDSVVKAGDTVGGATVVDIQKDRVIVHTGENYMELRINEDEKR